MRVLLRASGCEEWEYGVEFVLEVDRKPRGKLLRSEAGKERSNTSLYNCSLHFFLSHDPYKELPALFSTVSRFLMIKMLDSVYIPVGEKIYITTSLP